MRGQPAPSLIPTESQDVLDSMPHAPLNAVAQREASWRLGRRQCDVWAVQRAVSGQWGSRGRLRYAGGRWTSCQRVNGDVKVVSPCAKPWKVSTRERSLPDTVVRQHQLYCGITTRNLSTGSPLAVSQKRLHRTTPLQSFFDSSDGLTVGGGPILLFSKDYVPKA